MRYTLSALLSVGLLSLPLAPAAHAVSCTMSSAMTTADRTALMDAVQTIGGQIVHNNAAALKANSIPALAGSFDAVASTIASVAPELAGATLTVNNLYALDAKDVTSTDTDVQFFCSVPATQLLVTVSLGALPPGDYAMALVHATGVAQPQQFGLVLQKVGTQWQLGGLFVRPMTLAGHGSEWYWAQARDFKSKNGPLSAYLYYQVANYLSRPADLFSSNNLDKLNREMDAVKPQNLPGAQPMQLSGQGQTFPITGLSSDADLGPLDLRIDTTFANTADPVAARKYALDLMHALLAQYPDLRTSFHGLWVYETGPNNGSFAVEQPMTALQ